MIGSTVRITDRRNLYYRKVRPYVLTDLGGYAARYKRGLQVIAMLRAIQHQHIKREVQ